MNSKSYQLLRSVLSHKNKGRISKMLYFAGHKPKANSSKTSSSALGTIVFSADFEMAWAFRHSKTMSKNAIEAGIRERSNIPTILSLFDDNRISATWATVGHLFLPNCSLTEQGIPHPEMPRPGKFENRNWNFDQGDWYADDPCSDLINDPAWYAADLIRMILNSKVKHEIGCHTFSHIDCSYLNCDKTLIDAELKKCILLAKGHDIQLESFVFPGGTFGNFETLKANGFTCYRKPMKNHIDLPYTDEFGLVAIPSSYGLDRDSYGWSVDFHKKIISAFIKKTIESRQVCHFWFHPSLEKWYLDNVFPFVLQSVAYQRDKGNIEVLTMGEIARKYFIQ